MMEANDAFTRSLVRMLQNGVYKEWLGCADDQCTKVEFRVQRRYHVHVARRQIVVKEQDVESVRQQANGRWQWARPTAFKARRIVIDRATGKILEAPSWGVAQPPMHTPKRQTSGRKPEQRQERQPKPAAFVGTP